MWNVIELWNIDTTMAKHVYKELSTVTTNTQQQEK